LRHLLLFVGHVKVETSSPVIIYYSQHIVFFIIIYPTVTFNYGCFLVQCYVTKNHPDKTKSDLIWIELPGPLCLEQFSSDLIKIRLGLDFKYAGLMLQFTSCR
jgi:hypothetical protein